MLKVMTSNIRFENPADGPNDWPYRKDILAKIIKKYDPQILCTQEGRRSQLLDLNSLISQNIIDGHRSFISARMYPSIYKSNDIHKLISRDIWLSQTPNVPGSFSFQSAFPRLATLLKANYKGREILIVNTHLDHVLDTTRNNQIIVLINELKKVYKNEYLIICGDFNSSPQSFVHNILLNSFNVFDPWSQFYTQEESTHHPFTGSNPLGDRIDWILIDKRLQVNNFEIVKDNIYGKYPSDHFPIFTEVTW